MHFLIPWALLALWHVCTASASCVHNTHLHPRCTEGKDGEKVRTPNFGYAGDVGPTNWQAIGAANMLCAAGLNQSPISIKAAEMPQVKPGDIKLEISVEQEMLLENLGTTVEVLLEGTTTIGEKKFKLKQFHYHTPGEHRIDDEYYPVEVHMVHEAEDDTKEIAVIAFLFQLTGSPFFPTDNPSSIFSTVLDSISSILNPGDSIPIPKPDLNPLTSSIPKLSFYSYSGSLTTPPCAEDVTFLMAVEPLPMPVETFNALKKVVKFNSRFVQNGLGEQNLLSLSRMQMDDVMRKQNGQGENGDALMSTPKDKDFGIGEGSGERIVILAGNEGTKKEEEEVEMPQKKDLRLRKRKGERGGGGAGGLSLRNLFNSLRDGSSSNEDDDVEEDEEDRKLVKKDLSLRKRKGGGGGAGGAVGGGKGGGKSSGGKGGGGSSNGTGSVVNPNAATRGSVPAIFAPVMVVLCGGMFY